MGEANTDTLRQLATKWTLAGDDTLLTLLQNTHQKILLKCQEVNTQLEDMVSSLDDASIHLQNVNNKFMSLSNKQFIESRVYDDDVDLSTDKPTDKETPQPQLSDELSMLKNSLAILDSTHEMTEIMDDSDSDSDNEISVVLKPKDMYSNRPLPYIIGSQQWKNKWHAGLIIENSDSESIHSKGNTDMEYSDTDTDEQIEDRQMDNTISESSSLHSDRVQESNLHTAAQIAANIANVMAQTQPLIERPVTPQQKQHTQPPAVYRPTEPITSTVFLDEPPPLDKYDSDSSEHDIFAEINKKNIKKIINTNNSNVADDLFGDNQPYDEGHRVRNTEQLSDSYHEQKPTLIQRQLDTESIEKEELVSNEDGNITKKPFGGISLFGSNKNTDTIGAAILKRNLRHTSTSDESDEEVKANTSKPKTEVKQNIEGRKDINKQKTDKNQNIDELDNKTTPNKDIFDDLFSKKVNKIQKEEKMIKNEIKKKEVNLFSDNIFDDVDDIFSSNVKVASKTSKSLFDSDDDLFSDIAKPKSMKPETSSKKSKTVENLFESDDELFNDLKSTQNKKDSEAISTEIDTNSTKKDVGQESTNINKVDPSEPKATKIDKGKVKQDLIDINITKTGNIIKAKSIFDSDSDDDIFNFTKSTTQKSDIESSSGQNLKTDHKKFTNPLIFDNNVDDDEEISALFTSENSTKVPINKNKFNNNTQQGKFDSFTKTIESHSQDQKETLTPSEEDLNIENQSSTEKVEEPNKILVKEIPTFNLKEDSTKSNEENAQNTTTTSEIIEPNFKEKVTLEPDTYNKIFNEGLVRDKQSLNEHLAKENENLFKENEIIFKTDNLPIESFEKDLYNEKIFENEANKNENLPEIPIFNENEQKLNDILQNTNENLFIENKTQVTKDLPSPNDNLQPLNKNLNMPHEKFSQIANDLNIPSDNFQPVDLSIPNENILQSSKLPEVPAIFDDILTEPPIFEKTKEPKKSKNVNALFDDDSEDEALFFKKNDVISDVKPDIFRPKPNFGLFADEPPAIDDFDNDLSNKNDALESKFTKNESSEIKSDELHEELLSKSEANEYLFTESDKMKSTVSTNVQNDENQSKSDNLDKPNLLKHNLFQDSSDEEIFTEKLPKLPEKSNLDKNETLSIFDDLDDNLFTTKKTVGTNILNQEIPKKSNEETKKIGKINTQNMNINVQALIPGASPKKVKIESEMIEPKTDISERNVPEKFDQNTSQLSKPTIVKSISFEDSPDTDVLDNNASKKRAKIQVKRRPSSRKARHEAVRKSIIETSKNLDTDKEELDTNKASFDIDKKDLNTSEESLDTQSTINKKEQSVKLDIDTNAMSTKDKCSEDIDTQILDTEKAFFETKATDYKEQNKPVTKLDSTENEIKEKSTKIVYVLNDEDIFQTNKKDFVESTHKQPAKSLFDDDESDIIVKSSSKTKSTKISLFDDQSESIKAGPTKSLFDSDKTDSVDISIKSESTKISLFDNQNDLVETSQTKKDSIKKEPTKISLFDSDEEDEKSLFKTKPIVKKTKLFDSDSDEDLFSSTKTKIVKHKLVKKSLFDDENEEVFGAKTDKIGKKSTEITTKESSKKTIFADPLSLFGDDDDD